MFGKIMGWPDGFICPGFELCTRVSMQELADIKNSLESGASPRDLKAKLAKEIVKLYCGEKKAEIAEEEFNKVFRSKELPSDIPVFSTDKKNYFISDLLAESMLAPSKNEAKRLVDGGAVEIQTGDKKEKIIDWKKEIVIEDGMIIKVGHRKFVKIKTK